MKVNNHTTDYSTSSPRRQVRSILASNKRPFSDRKPVYSKEWSKVSRTEVKENVENYDYDSLLGKRTDQGTKGVDLISRLRDPLAKRLFEDSTPQKTSTSTNSDHHHHYIQCNEESELQGVEEDRPAQNSFDKTIPHLHSKKSITFFNQTSELPSFSFTNRGDVSQQKHRYSTPTKKMKSKLFTERISKTSQKMTPSKIPILEKHTPQKISSILCPYAVNTQNFRNKNFPKITAYHAQTHTGLYRNYNEDRVSIILNILLENSNGETVSKSSMFSLFDGHAGHLCANFLKEKLHVFITQQPEYVFNKLEALRKGLLQAELEFEKLARSGSILDISGSCAITAIIEDQYCYVANVGDSRGLLSLEGGKLIEQITEDHKPESDSEKQRLEKAGGGIFRKEIRVPAVEPGQEDVIIYGPYRVRPGGLSVSRTIGDIPSKDEILGGNMHCLIPNPDTFRIDLKEKNPDFLLLGCDGVFDELTNQKVINAAWRGIKKYISIVPLKIVAKNASEYVIKECFDYKSMDNITVVLVLFRDKEYYKRKSANISAY